MTEYCTYQHISYYYYKIFGQANRPIENALRLWTLKEILVHPTPILRFKCVPLFTMDADQLLKSI